MQLVISAFTNISQKAFLFVMHKEERIANKINCCHGNVMPQQVKNAVLCTRKGWNVPNLSRTSTKAHQAKCFFIDWRILSNIFREANVKKNCVNSGHLSNYSIVSEEFY